MRELRFWIRQSLMAVLGGLGMGILMLVLMGIQSYDGGWSPFPEMVPLYLLIGGAYVLLIMMLMAYKIYLPLSMSLGSTRKMCFWGLQLMKWVSALMIPALAYGFYWVVPESEPYFQSALPVFAAIILLAGTMGDFAGMAFYRWGKLGAILTIVVIVLAAMALGAGCAVAVSGSVFSFGGVVLEHHLILPLSLGAALAVYALNALLESRLLKTYEVKL